MNYSDCISCRRCTTKRELRPSMRRHSDYVVLHKCARFGKLIASVKPEECPIPNNLQPALK